MSVDSKEAIREKLAQSRRLLQQTDDVPACESLRTYIEELEGRLVRGMGQRSNK